MTIKITRIKSEREVLIDAGADDGVELGDLMILEPNQAVFQVTFRDLKWSTCDSVWVKPNQSMIFINQRVDILEREHNELVYGLVDELKRRANVMNLIMNAVKT